MSNVIRTVLRNPEIRETAEKFVVELIEDRAKKFLAPTPYQPPAPQDRPSQPLTGRTTVGTSQPTGESSHLTPSEQNRQDLLNSDSSTISYDYSSSTSTETTSSPVPRSTQITDFSYSEDFDLRRSMYGSPMHMDADGIISPRHTALRMSGRRYFHSSRQVKDPVENGKKVSEAFKDVYAPRKEVASIATTPAKDPLHEEITSRDEALLKASKKSPQSLKDHLQLNGYDIVYTTRTPEGRELRVWDRDYGNQDLRYFTAMSGPKAEHARKTLQHLPTDEEVPLKELVPGRGKISITAGTTRDAAFGDFVVYTYSSQPSYTASSCDAYTPLEHYDPANPVYPRSKTTTENHIADQLRSKKAAEFLDDARTLCSGTLQPQRDLMIQRLLEIYEHTGSVEALQDPEKEFEKLNNALASLQGTLENVLGRDYLATQEKKNVLQKQLKELIALIQPYSDMEELKKLYETLVDLEKNMESFFANKDVLDRGSLKKNNSGWEWSDERLCRHPLLGLPRLFEGIGQNCQAAMKGASIISIDEIDKQTIQSLRSGGRKSFEDNIALHIGHGMTVTEAYKQRVEYQREWTEKLNQMKKELKPQVDQGYPKAKEVFDQCDVGLKELDNIYTEIGFCTADSQGDSALTVTGIGIDRDVARQAMSDYFYTDGGFYESYVNTKEMLSDLLEVLEELNDQLSTATSPQKKRIRSEITRIEKMAKDYEQDLGQREKVIRARRWIEHSDKHNLPVFLHGKKK